MGKSDQSVSIRTFLLIENRLLRESLARLFRKRTEMSVVGQVSSAEDGPLEQFEDRCDVVLGDCHVLDRLMMMAPLAVRGESPVGAKVVLIGMGAEEEQFMAAVRMGVSGYLLQDATASDVVAAVRSVCRGEAICPPQMCAALFSFVAHFSGELPTQNGMAKPDLTLRQQQLITLVAKGLTNKEIASRLNLSAFTVRNHIHRILKQVDAESRSEAVETIRAHGYSLTA
jgi:two-component system nitrate/nitrite response regulator NarL